MPKRTSKKKPPADLNELAAYIVDEATAEDDDPPKNPAAVALGRLGGLKGGKVRMARLTPEERSALARKAARARWGKKDETPTERSG